MVKTQFLTKDLLIMKDNSINIFYNEELFRDGSPTIRSIRQIDLDTLANELSEFKNKLRLVFGKEETSNSPYELDEITVLAEISSEGKVGLLGTGASVAAKASLTFKFKKVKTT
ncbi:hypothetical protein [Echinicola sp. 20G]|uniref:Pepco domain-containing protein n=1 Tax=Echinicola sp. 20G TaxID=2781961 RepID=UPI001910F79D|nr:hypothetical protein [Echinicola sp. 20G]